MSADPLAELQDRIAISDVLHRYAAAIDGKDWERLRSCFTDAWHSQQPSSRVSLRRRGVTNLRH